MVHSEFLHFFPTPKYLQMPTSGLDISDDAVRFIELRQDRNAYLLDKYDSRPLPSNVIQNGVIQEPKKLVSALDDLRKSNDLNFVRVSLPEEKSYLYHSRVPYLSDGKKMRESVLYTIEENVPLSADEVVFDYDVIANRSIEESEEVDIVVSVLPVEIVDQYLDVIVGGKLQPLSLMVESQAIARAVVDWDNSNGVLVINIREGATSVYVVNNNVVHFTSAFTTKGGSMSTPLRMSFVENDTEQTEEEKVEEDKELEGFVGENSTAIANEVRRVLDYWSSHAIGSQKGNEIKKIILCGNQASNRTFKQALSSQLQLDIETANVWTNALSFEENIPTISVDKALRYAAAIGLALPQQY